VEDLGAALPAQAPRHGGRGLRIKWRGAGLRVGGRRRAAGDDDETSSRGRRRGERGRAGVLRLQLVCVRFVWFGLAGISGFLLVFSLRGFTSFPRSTTYSPGHRAASPARNFVTVSLGRVPSLVKSSSF
jgi:hypothetical protein